MKSKFLAVALTSVLAAGSLAGTAFPVKASTSANQTYLVAFKQKLPPDYQSIISKSGGKVLRALPEIGGLEVQSTDPSFLDNLKGISADVQAANVEARHKLDDEQPSAADGQPVTDIPQPNKTSSYWQYQWDIQRITHNGDSYRKETGGVKNPNGTVTHKAVVGVIDTGIDANHPDLQVNFLGGRNMVPAGVDAGETGDPTDVKDRQGHGTHVAGSIAANGKVKGVGPDLGIRSYRVFPMADGAATAWIVDGIVAASNDKVDVINMSIGGYDSMKYLYNGEKQSDIADAVLWERAVEYAVNHNVTVVAAAGNESLNLDDKKAVIDYMNQNNTIPGVVYEGKPLETPGTSNLKSYALLHGTSMASPKVAGIGGNHKGSKSKSIPFPGCLAH
ncbi:S8 family serine peptidase [Aneurinibacillus tyrosinisolvens]|uniref:S8 family serine peptidase n=1 Tax=Aneurinibacillus tyrosinisolvens TaxID=1443435 RepID=UPI000AA09A57|nr:S8 family serine peptidase [Aneurinibacillus tyrosinisolvens]